MRATLAFVAVPLLHCASEAPTEPSPPGPAEWNRVVERPEDAVASAGREACQFAAGSLPLETHGDQAPDGSTIPIEHIIVIMQENRSFDHYWQMLPERGQPEADVAPADFSNPDIHGTPVPIFHETQYCVVDTNHEWAGADRQINGGKMDGFVVTNEGHSDGASTGLDPAMYAGKRAMGYFDESDLPYFYSLATTFAIGDRYFASVAGPTYPNRMFLYAATSWGYTFNSIVSADLTLFDQLNQREISWNLYLSGVAGLAIITNKLLEFTDEHVKPLDAFEADAAAGTLPAVSFVDAKLGATDVDDDSEHPPALPQLGEAFVRRIVDAAMRGPGWGKTAIFLTYDEHGGFYDHVPPPPACSPDDSPLRLTNADKAANLKADFTRLGVRVPFVVISPYAKKGFVSHTTYDHTSIVRFIEARHVLPAMTRRDANAAIPWDMFDFDAPAFVEPPALSPPRDVTAELAACKEIF